VLERFTWFKQSAYLWAGEGLAVYIDPWGVSDGSPAADLLLITHAHFDHFSLEDIEKIRKDSTKIYAPPDVAKDIRGQVTTVAPGDCFEVTGVSVQAVPAYNLVQERLHFHPKVNNWVGYILSLEGKDYYHAGDTDHLEELESVKSDVAFVPIGGSYTMDHAEAAGFVKAISPRLAVPMHYGYVAGTERDALAFKQEAGPIPVEILTPRVPFELD